MTKRKRTTALACVLFLVLLLAGCGGERADLSGDPLCGEWAYNHDPETPVLVLKASGEAALDGAAYTWQRCESGIRLTAKDGTAADHRCVEKKDGFLFYRPAKYTAQGGHDGLIGLWKSENNWSYEFTGKGTFLEDGVLPGHYFVDEAAGTIRLAYNDPLEDTLLYYTLSGDTLLVDYPWPMVRAG